MNIEYEKRLIDLLGYSIEGPDNSNRWKIFDSEHKSVGFIQFKKLYNKNIKKGYPATYGYRTEISSDKISFRYSRKAYDKDSKFFSQNDDNHYSFELICPNQEKNDIIELNFGEYPSINIWSKKYGYLIFNIDYNGLYLNFKSETENYDIRELLIYNAVDELEKAYSYQISYSNKNVLPGKKKTRTREISGYSNRYYHDIGKIKIFEKYYMDDKLKNSLENDVAGSIEEMAIKHQMGIDAFNHFRYLINQIIPFNEEIINLMIDENIINEYNLGSFIQKENPKKKCNK